MCTAIYLNNHIFGRNLDVVSLQNEKVILTARNYPIPMRYSTSLISHYAILGIGLIEDEYPLYYDGMNEKGVCIASLSLLMDTHYQTYKKNKENICVFELIPYLLGTCKNIEEVKARINTMNLVDTSFSKTLQNTPLHFMICDKKECIVLESGKEGLKVYDNPYHILTNAPTFPYHIMNLSNYMYLNNTYKQPTFLKEKAKEYSYGLSAFGLPGDFSSMSRFVRGAYLLENVISKNNLVSAFYILSNLMQLDGCTKVSKNQYEKTLYTSCMDLYAFTYYYRVYDKVRIKEISMYSYDLNSNKLYTFSL